MLKVKRLIELLQQFDEDANCYAYEGEITGVIITKDGKEIGEIICTDDKLDDEGINRPLDIYLNFITSVSKPCIGTNTLHGDISNMPIAEQ